MGNYPISLETSDEVVEIIESKHLNFFDFFNRWHKVGLKISFNLKMKTRYLSVSSGKRGLLQLLLQVTYKSVFLEADLHHAISDTFQISDSFQIPCLVCYFFRLSMLLKEKLKCHYQL